MANVKISNLTAATTPVAGTEVLPIVQSGATVKVSIANLTAGRAVSVLSLTSTNDSTISGLTVGKGAGAVSTNTAVGASALAANSAGTVTTAIGYQALTAQTTANWNNSIGYQSSFKTTTGSANNVLGTQAFYNNTTGSNCVAIGDSALLSNTTASNNTAVGYQAGYSNTTANGSTFVGYQAGYSSNYTSGNTYNTFVGFQAGYSVTTGNRNVIIGNYSGNAGGLDIRTSSNNIVLSDGDGNPRLYRPSSGGWVFAGQTDGYDSIYCLIPGTIPYGAALNFTAAAPNNTINYFLAGTDTTNNKFTMRSNGGLANYSGNNVNLSDRREKTNFAPAGSYLDKICAISVQTFNYIDQNMEDDGGLTLGVVAQDVQAVAPEMVMESNWGTKEEPKMRLSIYQTDLQYALMKCIQELKAEVDSLKAQINGASA